MCCTAQAIVNTDCFALFLTHKTVSLGGYKRLHVDCTFDGNENCGENFLLTEPEKYFFLSEEIVVDYLLHFHSHLQFFRTKSSSQIRSHHHSRGIIQQHCLWNAAG